jgi:hypothetical protein
MAKVFRLSPDDIRLLATNRGGCIASDRITVDGELVGYMYRDKPNNELDSGWRFLAGDENAEYMAERTNHAVYDVNTIANYDPMIIPLLEAEEGAAFERVPGTFEFRAVKR